MTINRMFRGRYGRLGATALVLCASVLAILLWGRLKLVTGVPRTAMADPSAERARISQRMPRSRPLPGRDSRPAANVTPQSAFVGD